ncbi:MAG: hypothetical protein IPK97_01815 [Ahniella sp.]|nr:hypothetical protein [Ahniella sp.]
MRFTLKPLAFAALSCLALSACQDGNDQVQTAKSASHTATTPAAAVTANLDALKKGDLKALVLSSAPPDMIEHMRTEWTKEMTADPITEEDRAKFNETMTMLTAEGAEQKLWQELEPKFKELQSEAQLQLPMWIGMGQGVLGSMVDERKDLNDAQKKQAKDGIQAFGTWASSAKFLDADLAQKSIGIVCTAARDMKLESLDQVRALKFEEALDKGNIGFRATKDLLANYGFSVDDVMNTMKAEVVSQEGDAAKVKVSYQMFQTPLEFESDMVRVDGGWYSKESVEKLRAEMAGAKTEPAKEDSAAES